jgi:hypothetical protein
MSNEYLNAALPDTRPQKERDRDYYTAEIAAAPLSRPYQNPKPTTTAATIYSQEYTGSCVPHGFLTQLEYEGLIPKEGISQLRAYRKRANYPAAGSGAVDMYTKIKSGQSIYADCPTPIGVNDSYANALPQMPGTSLVKDFSYYQYKNLAEVPYDIAAGKAVALFIYATEAEWAREYVEPTDAVSLETAYIRHCVCLIPTGDFTENGKKWLAVHDSAAFGGRHLRHISEEFLFKRAFFASKVHANDKTPTPPISYTPPSAPCSFGMSALPVHNLQAYLADKGYLDAKHVTGYYGAITAKAVLVWQLERWEAWKDKGGVKHLLDLNGHYWGDVSIALIKNAQSPAVEGDS